VTGKPPLTESKYKDIPEYKGFREAQRLAEAAAKSQNVIFKDLLGPEKTAYQKARDLWFRAKAALQPKTAPSAGATAAASAATAASGAILSVLPIGSH
jgi:hypothetical protein